MNFVNLMNIIENPYLFKFLVMKYFIICLSFFLCFNSHSQQANFEATGEAPNFMGFDLDGNYQEMQDYLDEGKIVVIELMNINCGACQAYAPSVSELYEQYGPSGSNQIEIIALEINNLTDDNACEEYMNEYNASYPLINGQNSNYYGYEMYYTPTFYIVFPDLSYTNFCTNYCLNSTSVSNMVNDFGEIISNYFSSLNSPFGDEPDTDCNSTILIQSTTNITLNNEEVPFGSWIGVFYNNENNELIYGGGIQWNGEVTSIAAWGSEAGMNNGFESGEEFTFGIFDSETNQTIFSNNSEFSFGQNTYSCNGLSGLTSISFETNSENNDSNPWGNEPDTDCNSTILIQPITNITLNNEEVPFGSWIGVFFNNENNELIYGGGIQWNGEVTSIAAWGSEAGMNNGFESGEEFTFGIFDSETNQTIFSNNSEFSFGQNTYSCNGLSGLTSISFETNSENNCFDNNEEVNVFGGCSEAVSLLGCNFNFSGTLIEDICPVSCDNCENSTNLQVEGCTDENALNFNPIANIDDGSCLVLGCTDENAFNYDDEANIDDGSCIILGCTDSNATNYSPLANTDDASCNYDSNNDITPSDWVIPDTDCNATILISSLTYMSININDGPITNGDLLGVFYTNADGELSCGGYTEWTGETTSIAAWGSEAGMDNGFQADEEYTWYIFDIETQQSIEATNVTMMFGENFYSCNGLSGLGTLDAFTTTQGCTDNNAYNFIENAEEDDGSCCYLAGCLDETAFNYDSTACFDDGSCISVIEGCTDSNAFNYNSNANTDDESCCYLGGCTDPSAFNYDSSVCFNDGSCIEVVEGCTDSEANNFNPQANTDNGICEFLGCMNIEAWNYDLNANIDDGSCFFSPFGPEPDSDCNGTILIPAEANITIDEEPIPFGTWIGVFYSDDNGELAYGGGTQWNGEVTSIAAWGAEAGDDNGFQNGEIFTWGIYNIETNEILYTENINYSFGDGTYFCNSLSGIININIITISCNDVNAFNYNPSENDCENCCCYIAGCLDETAFNYDSTACFDDGSCISVIEGCTDSNAFNYNSNANTDDESCCYLGGCTDPFAFNYDSSVCFNDGSCIEIVEGCTDSEADNFNPQANTDNQSCEFLGCMNIEAWNYDLNANIDDGSCFFSPFGPEPDSDCNGTILIPAEANITIDEEPIPFGTWIGVFYSDDNGELAYGGGTQWNGEVTSIAAWGAEAGDDNGFQNGEIFTWGVYNIETNELIQMDFVDYSFGSGTYSCNGLNGISSLENEIILGCTDPGADNYDPQANVDDDSCQYFGCTDSQADNFDPQANVDDDSCQYFGCTDSQADNFDPQANVDDGSCQYFGCTDSQADNFDPQANVDDGSCQYFGCTDSQADNFDPQANVDDGSCQYFGCTDSQADNFDPQANVDDGTCQYFGCTDSQADNFDPQANVDDGTCQYFGCTDPDADNFNSQANVDDGTCQYFGCTDPDADNFNSQANVDDGTCQYFGCTDPEADNFNSQANVDDGTCQYFGCTDPDADNFNSQANVDDGTCQYFGCTDSQADNFDPQANVDNGLCIWSGCTDLNAINYWQLANNDNGSCYYFPGCTDANYLEFWTQGFEADFDNGSCLTIVIFGCIDDDADNFDENANFDDESCQYFGCMDIEADNFDSQANVDDESCIYLGCTDVLAVNFDSSSNTDDGSCDYGPWGPLEPTGTNHNIAIPTYATLTFDGSPLTNGDWIGLFYTSDQSGELINGGSVLWTGSGAANMVAWGAEAGMDNGFQEGEEFIWMIWDNETGEILPAVAEYDNSMPNTNLFANNGLSALTSLEGISDVSQTINLTNGWSLWSTYVHPENADISVVINPIVSSLDIVKDWEGNVYWPLFGINTIGEITRGEGYQIKTTSQESFVITGELTPSDYEINLPGGWFILGYLHQNINDAGEMMIPIYDNLIILKDYLGNVYWPMFGINTIGTMEPGKGYQIKIMDPFNYSYPSSGGARYGDVYTERPVHFDEASNTGNNMIIGLPLNAWESTPSIGDEIAAYGEDGELIGSTTFQGNHIALTVWGDDLTTDKKDGISEGESISFKLWNSQTGVEQTLEVRWSEGVGFYTTDGISIAGQIILGSELASDKKLVRITDMLGRDVNGDEKDVMLLYIYDDGSIERVLNKN